MASAWLQLLRLLEPVVTRASVSLSPADDVPPYFKTEPVRTQVHLEGNRLVLTCMAEGSWPLEFKWLHNNRELTRFSLEYRQELPTASPSCHQGREGGAGPPAPTTAPQGDTLPVHPGGGWRGGGPGCCP